MPSWPPSMRPTRLSKAYVTVLIVVSIVSLLLSLMPTDYYFTEDELMKLTDEQKNAILSAAGLLDNPFEQLFHFLKNLFLHGDLGVSRRIQAGVPVLTVIGGKFGISMKMGSIALVISLLLGVPMGILQAKYKNGAFDNAGTVYTIGAGREGLWPAKHVFYEAGIAFEHYAGDLPCAGIYCELCVVDAPLHDR